MASPVICIGAALIDELYFCEGHALPGTSNPASLQRFAGGVTRNIAHHLAMLDVPVQLMAVIGDDTDGDWLYQSCKQQNIGVEAIHRVPVQTGKYAAILNRDGSMYTAACTDPCAAHLTTGYLESNAPFLQTASMIVADTNLSISSLEWIISFCRKTQIPLLVEPVSVAKAAKLSSLDLNGIYMITPNEDELSAVTGLDQSAVNDAIQTLLEQGISSCWLRKGVEGSILFKKEGSTHFPAIPLRVTDSTGAGDAALAGWVAARYHGMNEENCIKAGHVMAHEVLQVPGAVIPNITYQLLKELLLKYYPNE